MQIKHLKILGKGDEGCLSSPEIIKQLLTDLIDSVGMQLLGEIHVWEVPLSKAKLKQSKKGKFKDEGGVTSQAAGIGSIVACGTLTTSHVAIHTWPLRKEFHLDLYSCCLFDPEPTLEVIKQALFATLLQVTDCTKGTNWDIPEDLPNLSCEMPNFIN